MKQAATSTRGFTLIELLTSMAILILIMAALTAAFNQTSRVWTQAENRVETFQGARLALEMIGRELETALVTSNNPPQGTPNYIPFKAIQGTTDGDISSYGGGSQFAALNTSVGGSVNDQIFFVAPTAESSSSLNIELHEYGYFVAYAKAAKNSINTNGYYLLRMDNDATSAGFDPFTNANWYQTPSSSSSFAGSTKPPILDNVLRFKLDYVDTNANGVATWPKDDYLPLAVNITMTVLDRRAADRLLVLRPNGLTPAEQANIPDNVAGIPDPALRQLLQESARTFYKRVDLINAQVP